ncbi:MAG TPA: DeoR family transcriptional regulator [bacterium]|jgi:transcriptional regulator of heat shock response|nr:DeoR family transcriptional regulator [bacterium]HNZ51594.1 DeoR family transcriptional regulator [bacterium]HOF79651.1 DeoR family transcriptional regulator [bacterium]HOH85384.1 DeoR family transcriptional regulator [bacterium]HOQ91774.1 DeoR family transcriptional regulator [bacterium]
METRPALILKLLTEDYIQTATPVASQALVDKYHLNFSPATVRNDLADLEEAGYIIQPHTSAGRIPTELAYRQLIATIEPKAPTSTVKKLLEPVLADFGHNWKPLAKALAQLTNSGVFWSFHRYDSYYTGLSGLLGQPEFKQLSMIYDISQVIDSLEEIIDDLFNQIGEEPTIRLGNDSPFGAFSSTILTKYRFDQHIGLFGLLAPLRTDYQTNFNLINYVYRAIQEKC